MSALKQKKLSRIFSTFSQENNISIKIRCDFPSLNQEGKLENFEKYNIENENNPKKRKFSDFHLEDSAKSRISWVRRA